MYEHGANAPRKSVPKDEGHRPNYYTVADEGQNADFAEKGLSKVESVVAPIIRKLGSPQFKMTESQVGELYLFVAVTYVRVPALREYLDTIFGVVMKEQSKKMARNKEEFYRAFKEADDEIGNSIGDYEKVREFLLSDRYTVVQGSAGFNIGQALKLGLTFAEVFYNEYRHDIYYAPAGTYFVTCDNPVVTLEPDFQGGAIGGVGIRRPWTEVVFPLNKRACLFLRRNGKSRSLTATSRQVDGINNMIMTAAQKYMYAPIGHRRLARIFTERGCKLRYGGNALLPDISRFVQNG